MRAASKIAPAPTFWLKTPDECALVPSTRSVHPLELRRATTPNSTSPLREPASKPSAMSLWRAELDQVAARDVERTAGALLVAGEDDADRDVVERAGLVQRLERLDDDDVAALHVGDARAARDIAVAFEGLERAVLLEDRVQMTDQEEPLAARAHPLGDEVAGPLERERHRHPPHVEAQRFQLGGEEVGDGAYAARVHRAAVDVDQALEQVDRLFLVLVDVVHDSPLDGRELRLERRGEGKEQRASQHGHEGRGTSDRSGHANLEVRCADGLTVSGRAARAAPSPSRSSRKE